MKTFTVASSLFSVFLSVMGGIHINKELKKSQKYSEEMRQMEKTSVSDLPCVSVIVPVRNEQKHIVGCLTSILEQEYPNLEVIAVDDNSTDNTPELLAELKQQYGGRLKILNSTPPSGDWLGKNNALWQGYEAVSPNAQWILFMDADVNLTSLRTLKAAIEYAQTQKLDLLSLLPAFRLRSFWTKVITPEITKLYGIAGTNPFNPPKPGSVEEAVAVGAFILVREEAYQAVGGHRALRNLVLEDIEMARTFRSEGFTTLGFPAADYLEWEQYENISDLWESVTKNLYFVGRKSWGNVFFVVGIELLYALVPFITLSKLVTAKKQKRSTLALNLLSVGLLLAIYARICKLINVPLRFILLYPVSVLMSSILMLHSALKATFGKSVNWKGRRIVVG